MKSIKAADLRGIAREEGKKYAYIPSKYVNQSLGRYETNVFAQILESNFGNDAKMKMVNDYKIGTSKTIPGASVFWWLDETGNANWGDVLLLNPYNANVINRTAVVDFQPHDYVLSFFGEPLLQTEKEKPIVIVTRPAIAVIGSYLYSEYSWLSTTMQRTHNSECGYAPKTSYIISEKMLKSISGRNAIWFPESGFDKLDKFKFIE